MIILAVINIEMPEEMIPYAIPLNKESQLTRNAMILYPYVHDGVISYGKAAEILGIFKMDLIVLYGKLGLPYIEMTDEEIDEELLTVNYLKEVMA